MNSALLVAGRTLGRCMVVVFALAIGAGAAHGADHAPRADPLFAAETPLEITLRAPFAALSGARDASRVELGALVYTGADGTKQQLRVEVEVRGKNRLKRSTCRFPPLRIAFVAEDTPGTLFEGQKDLKLVTQCDPASAAYERYLIHEYLAYRIFNEVTPNSFRVRMLRIEYVDSNGTRPRQQLAFFIEDKDGVARRIGGRHLSLEQTSALDLDQAHLNRVSLFQLLIGNVDYSATSGGSGECCHNAKLFEAPGGEILSIPYDFDLSGLVNAKYAKPDVEMGLKSVRDRRYRGYCRNNAFLAENIALFNLKRPAILALIETNSDLPASRKRSSIRYVESFYEIVNDPKRIERVILGSCHESIFVEVDA